MAPLPVKGYFGLGVHLPVGGPLIQRLVAPLPVTSSRRMTPTKDAAAVEQ